MDVEVRHRRLWEAVPGRGVKLHDEEIEQIRDLLSVDLDDDGWRHYSHEHVIRVSEADANRWRAATEAVVSAHRSVEARALAAHHRRWPPPGFGQRLVWWARYLFREGKRRREYENTIAALEVEILDAYRAFRDAAADLTHTVERERQREERERRAKRERERREEAAAMVEAVDGAVWACQVVERGGRREVEIWLPALGNYDVREDAQVGLTARQVQEVVERERSTDRYIWIDWEYRTRKAMTDWYARQDGSDAADPYANPEELAWQTLTGVLVDSVKLRPEERRDRGTPGYGPSSNYWSPSTDSFGTSF